MNKTCMVLTDIEKRAIDEAVKADPWAFIHAHVNSDERPLADLMDWMLARDAVRQSSRTEIE